MYLSDRKADHQPESANDLRLLTNDLALPAPDHFLNSNTSHHHHMSASIPYRFTPGLVLRTPALPFRPLPEDGLAQALVKDDAFLEAIYLASPVLYNECIKWRTGQLKVEKEIKKLQTSLLKYYQRMRSRCTPFGLFSGCTYTHWQEGATRIIFRDTATERHTRPDMHYLCALAQHLATVPVISERLLWFPNNSIYTIGDELRYVEYKYKNGRRVHQISSVSNSHYLQEVLAAAANGILLSDIRSLLSKETEDAEEAAAFTREILDAQLLVNELEPAITGPEFIFQLLAVLKKMNTDADPVISQFTDALQNIQQQLEKMDQSNVNAVAAYKQITEAVKALGVDFDESKLFQTDLFRPVISGRLNQNLQTSLFDGFRVFVSLFREQSHENLDSFAKRFAERYENTPMPLLHVLDNETGIGYFENSGRDISPLTDELQLPPGKNRGSYPLQWSADMQWLFAKLKEAHAAREYEIEITDKDLEGREAAYADLPPSVSVMFRITNDAQNQVFVESIGGSSAINLLGRFAHGDPAIQEAARSIAEMEQQQNPAVLFADVVHLPESRVGNILLHPVFRDYEIPYLAKAGVTEAFTLPPDDLYVSVENGSIYLWSERLQKRIIPRLSSAHNYSNRSLPVYHFLCDLQNQELRSAFSFHWGPLSGHYKFLPRVVYKNCILHEACWQLTKEDLTPLIAAVEKNEQKAVCAFITEQRLPRWFVLADGDNELLVDTASAVSLSTFVQTVKERPSVVLKEFMYDPQAAIKNEQGEIFVNQFIASLVKTEKVYAAKETPVLTAEPDAGKTFVPGSEWLYYKFYCGIKSADKLLTECIDPLVTQLQQQGLITNWFFIRYSDPSFHLRVRFLAADAAKTGVIMQQVHLFLQQEHTQRFIWKTQLDTYQRERERYGYSNMELSETLFTIDSSSKLAFLRLTDGDEREQLRWAWGLRVCDALLNSFGYTTETKQLLMAGLKDGFSREFNADKNLFLQLNKKYNAHKEVIKRFLGNPEDEALGLLTAADDYGRALLPVAAAMKVHFSGDVPNSIIGSYLHMSLNRLFPSDARLQEFIAYEFLNRWYQSQLKMQNQSKKQAGLK